jgi:predicted regulator of Ras-like GTPase activity (Roadblock/LC7/MglB family)
MSTIATAVKAKIAGFLRRLLYRFDDHEAARQPAQPAPRPVATAKTLVMPPPVMPPQAARPQVKPVTPTAQPAPPAFTPPIRPANPDELQLPLQPIIDALPMELRARVKRTDTANLTALFPLEQILTKLALGTVKITFGELRRAAPGVFSDVDGGHDPKPVTLPLNEILTRLNPGLLARRIAQKHIEVSDDIASPFGGQGQGLKLSPPPANPPAPAMGVPPSRIIRPVPAVAAKAQSPSTVLPPSPFPVRSITPAVNGNGSATRNITSVIPPAAVEPPGPPVTPIAPITPISPIASTPISTNAPINGSATRNIAPVIPPAAAEPPCTPVTPIAPSPISTDTLTIRLPEIPALAQPTLSVPLSALLANWPDALKLEIVQLNLSSAQVALPLDSVETGLKRGRVAFSWRNLRALIKPAPPGVSAHDAVELELPLHVIAPLFLARQNGANGANGTVTKSPQKIADAGEIPNLFFGSPAPQPATTPPAPPSVPPFAPIIPVLPAGNSPVAAPVAKLPDTNFFLRNDVPQVTDTEFKRRPSPGTDFLSRGATPKEVVERATILEGVAGAIVALPDGLKVASKIPPELNADTLAAFLPQLFGRVTQCSKELRMGELNNLNFTVGNVPWKIFRVNAVYFAAFGRAGQALPTAQLVMLANELDRKRL